MKKTKKTPKKTQKAEPKAKRTARKDQKTVHKEDKAVAREQQGAPKMEEAPLPETEKEAGPPETETFRSPPESLLTKYDPLQRYLWEIGQHKLLTKEEEKELAIRVMKYGDRDAAYKLVTSNLRLVVKIAMEFQRVWMQNLLDLIQEGNIGLMQAVRKFDPYKEVRFSYYASFWIKAYILKFIMDNWRLVKIGTTQAQRKLFFRLKKEKQRLIAEGFDPKPKLLSERLGVTEQEVTDMDQRLDGWELSLDAPIKEGSEDERSGFIATDQVSAETQVAKKEMKAILHEKIAAFRKELNEREIEILEQRVLSDRPATLQEIGERYGVSRERVRQIENNMIQRMKAFFEREIPDFDSFLGGLNGD